MKIFEYYFYSNQLILNTNKSSHIIIGSNSEMPVLYKNICIKRSTELKILGVIFDSKLKFDKHINHMTKKISKTVNMFSRLRHFVPQFLLSTLYKTLVLPHLTYGSPIWSFTYDRHIEKLVKLQKKMVRIVNFADFRAHSEELLIRIGWQPIKCVFKTEALKYIFKNINGFGSDVKFFEYERLRRTRSDDNKTLKLLNPSFKYIENSIFYKGVRTWNEIDLNIRSNTQLNKFLSHINIKFSFFNCFYYYDFLFFD